MSLDIDVHSSGIGLHTSTWTISSPPHACQFDSTSCGLYVIKLAECYLLGRNLECVVIVSIFDF